MKFLLICPLFGKDIVGGAEYYNYKLAQGLAEFGSVTVATTMSKGFSADGGFSLRWQNDYQPVMEKDDVIEIRRFSAKTQRLPVVGKLMSLTIAQRWYYEEKFFGQVLKGSQYYVDYCIKRALGRPAVYDKLFLSGLGPNSSTMSAYLRRESGNYDVVITSLVPFALPWHVKNAVKRNKTPVVFLPLFHSDDIYHHHKSFYQLFGSVDAILAQTRYSANLFQKLNINSKPYIVGPGVDVSLFSQDNISGSRFRAKYGLEDKFILMYVGRKEFHKRYDWAVQAVNTLADDTIRLVMIGADVDGLAIDSPYVSYLGKLPKDDLLDAYDACNVLVHPSEHESFGMVFLEAWMRRKPVIGNARCGSVASVITHGENGFLAWNSSDIASYVRQLVNEPGLAQTLGEAGYLTASTEHTWEHVVQKVFQVCQHVVRSG